jgi:hypothetical protein
MQITRSSNNELTIVGNIKSIEDSMEIKQAINNLHQKGAKSITLKITDSFSMTSTVIGHLMKLINIDKVSVSMIVGDRRLYEIIEELSLVQLFNVRMIG